MDRDERNELPARRDAEVPAEVDELPVVARMVVEIRSDGVRTVARGALDDRVGGQQVAVELTPSSPWQMAKELAKLIVGSVRRVRRARSGRVRSALSRPKPRGRLLGDDDSR